MKTWLWIVIPVFALAAFAAESLKETYDADAEKIIDAALAGNESYARLAYLCDRIGNRLSGSQSLNRAIEWAAAGMKQDGLQNVHTQPVKVPHWVRGRESGGIVAPIEKALNILGVGGSVATPKTGITAEVVVVTSFDEMEKQGRAGVEGKIVLFNAPYEGYMRTVQYRGSGASRAAKLGAVAVLVRSVTPVSLQSPHTGALEYASTVPKIPAASVTIEDAELLQRLSGAGGPVKVHLEMEAHTLPDADSANVIGEIVGREKPEEIVLIGGHIDSWDVGQGAQDDGSGIVTAMEAARLLVKLGLRPRRTLRVVCWTNEENGGAGAKAYRESVGGKIKTHVAAIEMDGGAEKPVGFGYSGLREPASIARLKEIAELLRSIQADSAQSGGGGADIAPLMRDGVPGLSLRTVGTHYFDWHHTNSDTVDKIRPEELRLNVAVMAVLSYVLADMPETLK